MVVVADPTAMTSLPEEDALRATALNSLGHGADALFGPVANPFSTLSALEGIELIAGALDEAPGDRDRVNLALGSLFCAHAIDGAGLSLHHAVCQELVRGVGIAHAETNATMLPHTMGAMREREPAAMEALARALGTELDGLPGRLTELGGGPRHLADLDPDREAPGRHPGLDPRPPRARHAPAPQPPGAGRAGGKRLVALVRARPAG